MEADTDTRMMPLLAPAEPPAYELVNAQGRSSALLVCDHASNRIPQQLGTLGLDIAQLATHIAWDPGAAEVARLLAEQLDAALVLSGYSRLVIDCNRPLQHAESIAAQSAGIPVPGNRDLSLQQRDSRINVLFRPYHEAIERQLAKRVGRANVLLSIHSFTPIWNGKPRPWHIGISCWREKRLAALLLDVLARDASIRVGENQPYPIEEDIDYTIPVHSDAHGIPSVMIEIRQDCIDTKAGATVWAKRLAGAYRLIEESALESGLEK